MAAYRDPVQRRGFLAGALSVPALAILPGCATSFSARAQEFADEVLPGRLRVVDVLTDVGGVVPFPTKTAVYAAVEDPDASVVLDRFDADQLRAAYAAALPAAVELRLFAAEMADRGFPVRGFRPNPGENQTGYACSLEAEVSDATMASIETELDAALTSWQQARATQRTDRIAGLAIGLIAPAATAALPELPDDQPLTRRLDHKQRNDALFAGATVFTQVYLAPDGTLSPVCDRMKPHPNLVARLRAEVLAVEAAAAWLQTQRPALVVDGEDVLVRRLRPGTATQLRLYVRARRSDTVGRDSTHFVAVSFALDTATVGDIDLLKRPAAGWPVPIEPEL